MTTAITGKITDAEGTALENVTVTCQLRPRPAFVTATGAELAPMIAVVTDSNGEYVLDLTPTADITPTNSFYEIVERIPDRYGGPVKHVIQVGASPATVYASLVSSPPAGATNTYLTQAAADARYVQSPGSFGAAGAMAETRPNDTADGGAETTYSRTDHRHDREITYGTAATRTGLAGTDLFEGLTFRETDGNDELYTRRAAAWIKVDDLISVADATARDAITTPYNGMRVRLRDNGLRFFYDGTGWYLEGEQMISRTVLGSAASSIASGTLPVIPNAGDLRIVYRLQHASAVGNNVNMTFNGDTAANYVRAYVVGNDTSVTGDAEAAATHLAFGTASNSSSTRWAQGDATFTDYRGNQQKVGIGTTYDPRNLATPLLVLFGLHWAGVSAITSVTLTAGSGNFVTSSELRIYARSTKG